MPITTSKFIKPAIALLLVCAACLLRAQPVDRIMAIVDNEIILLSDLNGQYEYAVKNGQKDDGTLRCAIFEQALMSKLLLSKAKADSLKVSDDQVESEMKRRVDGMAAQLGSIQELEKVYRKSLPEIKVDLRTSIRDQLLTDQQRQKIFDAITATPKEVKEFFNKIPKDSLPYLPAEVELSHVMFKPVASEASKAEAKKRLSDIRAQIASGQMKFEQMARFYGMDGTAQQDGYLGEFGRGMMTPEFEEVVYTLNEGAVSEVFETPFGYHIAKLHKKLGDRVTASHILIIPKILPEDEKIAMEKLMAIRRKILADSMTFEYAAAEFSEDKRTKDNGGVFLSNTGETRIPLDQLDADLYFKIDQMKVGDISEPVEYRRPGEMKAFHIVKLRTRIPPHLASLKDDYQKFQNACIQAKQAEAMEKWLKKSRTQVFIEIKDNDCSQALQNWF
jgi:peptidyl-prolyl cis-trans isomerase SurA